ncbi:MAG: prolyl oligopeptidase family serine peptidase, partial [Planctomycetes bacterium]|nr:prolyl oligopeptidase family serine peptidase [Planctomycetota bacterium]
PPGPPPTGPVPATEAAPRALASFTVRDWLVLGPVDGRGRRPLRPDAVVRDHLLKADAKPPLAGEIVRGEVDSASWTKLEAQADGALDGERFAWAYARIEREEAGVWMANLQGANTLYVNSEPFQGDVYRYGFGGVPVYLQAGANDVYVNGVRGGFTLRFDEPPAAQFVAGWDRTLPDVAGPFAVLDVNAANEWSGTGLPPLWVAKRALDTRDYADETGSVQGFGAPFGVLAKLPDAKYVTSFVSEIDGSVQSMGVSPPTGEDLTGAGLVLSLHGAGVPVRNQLGAHSRHEDFWIFVPTNRRPYGFDWQDWGRRDAYEVLERGISLSGVSRDRLYLLGHSMGGHGTWHLAANDPDTWAAIQPSAGWCSFDTYGSRPEGELAELWQDADGASRTLDLIDNLVTIPTFVVHGDADETVPISEAHAMVEALEAAGGFPKTYYHEDGGHWWDGDASKGADCLEWSGAFELFRRTSKPRWLFDLDLNQLLSWSTIDPAVDCRHGWVGVEQFLEQGKRARVEAQRVERVSPTQSGGSKHTRVITARTENVSVLLIDDSDCPSGMEVHVLLDDEAKGFVYADRGPRWFERRSDKWHERGAPDARVEKTPARNGNFKRAFDKHFLAVVGTHGDDETDAALLGRARHDAQQWWYRGNGRFETWTDDALASKKLDPQRNRILYGNADTNAAWMSSLPADCPVLVENGRVRIGEREWKGDDLACLFTYPLAGSDECVVGAFGFSGPEGACLAATFGTFTSGAGFPDLILVDSSVLTKGDGGVLAAGWFENDWSWAGGRVERGGELVEGAEEDAR